eukprot:1139894-Prymnesium_polylepis.1
MTHPNPNPQHAVQVRTERRPCTRARCETARGAPASRRLSLIWARPAADHGLRVRGQVCRDWPRGLPAGQ